MLLTLDKIGNWNPQLFREIKGRLTFRNVAIVAFASFVLQFFLVFLFSDHDQNKFFIIRVDGWLNIFKALNLILPMALVLGGAYMLISDMAKEERRGTLNFIRLSPQSSQVILIGKMLGVPVLLYLPILLVLPLHLWAAITAAVPLSLVFTFYLMVMAICSLFYSAALFYIIIGGTPWIGSILVVLSAYPIIVMLNSFVAMAMLDQFVDLKLEWFYLPLNSTFTIALFSLLSICLTTYGIWQFLNRRFRNPKATLISKYQSYLLVTCANLWILGFGVEEIGSSDSYYPTFVTLVIFLYFLVPFCFLILIAALSPHRQNLQDWARYRSEMNNGKKGKKKIFSAFPVGLQDLMFGEKSPSLLAIAINLAITAIIWIPGIIIFSSKLLGWEDPSSLFKTSPILAIALLMIISANSILICAAIAQFMLLIKTRKPQLWASATVATVILLPMTIACSGSPVNNYVWWLFSPFPAIVLSYASITTILSTIIAQWGILALLSLQLTRQLGKIGESASKAMLTSRPSLPSSR